MSKPITLSPNKIALIIIAVAVLAVFSWVIIDSNRTPVLSMSSDNIGSTSGGHLFIISGKNFTKYSKMKVLVNGREATDVRVLSNQGITARAPQSSVEGVVDVTVISPSGKSATLVGGFTYSKIKPEIFAVTPKKFDAKGGEKITVTGSGFKAGPIAVHFHTSVIPATIIDDTTLYFTAPAAASWKPVPRNVNLEISTLDDSFSSDEYGLNYR